MRPADEQKAVYAAYKALNETPGFTSGVRMQPPETATAPCGCGTARP